MSVNYTSDEQVEYMGRIPRLKTEHIKEYKICQTVNIKRKLCLALKAALHIFIYEKTECFSSYYSSNLEFAPHN